MAKNPEKHLISFTVLIVVAILITVAILSGRKALASSSISRSPSGESPTSPISFTGTVSTIDATFECSPYAPLGWKLQMYNDPDYTYSSQSSLFDSEDTVTVNLDPGTFVSAYEMNIVCDTIGNSTADYWEDPFTVSETQQGPNPDPGLINGITAIRTKITDNIAGTLPSVGTIFALLLGTTTGLALFQIARNKLLG